MQVARNSSEMENHVFKKAKTREEYMNMVAKLILHVRDYNGKIMRPYLLVINLSHPGKSEITKTYCV